MNYKDKQARATIHSVELSLVDITQQKKKINGSYYINNEEWNISTIPDVAFNSAWLINLGRTSGRSWECRWIEQTDVPSVVTQTVYDEFSVYITSLQSLATDTTTKLLNAINYAYNNGFKEVVLTKGKYVINSMIISDKTNFIVNFNGSSLYMLPNGDTAYNIIDLRLNNKVILKNAIIIGDKNTHNYKTNSTHEQGYGIKARGNINSKIEYCEIKETTGDAIYSGHYVFDDIKSYITTSDFEVGFIDDTGVNSLLKGYIRTTNYVTIPDTLKALPASDRFISLLQASATSAGIGNDTKSRMCRVCFYDSNHTFISKVSTTMCTDFFIPDNASYMRWVFISDTVPTTALYYFMGYIKLIYNKNLHILHSDLHDCRRQGISVGGGRNTLIKNNRIYNIKGIPPECGIDVEDADMYTENTVIDNNLIYNINSHGIDSFDGYGTKIINNTIRECGGYSIAVVFGKDSTILNNSVYQDMNLAALDCIVRGNTFNGCKLSGNSTTILKADKNYYRDLNLPVTLSARLFNYNFNSTRQLGGDSQYNYIGDLIDSDVTISAMPDLLDTVQYLGYWYNDFSGNLINTKITITGKPSNATNVTRRITGSSWYNSQITIGNGVGLTFDMNNSGAEFVMDTCRIDAQYATFNLAYYNTPDDVRVRKSKFIVDTFKIGNRHDKTITIELSDTVIKFSNNASLLGSASEKNTNLTVIFNNCDFIYTGTSKTLFDTVALATYKKIYFRGCTFTNCTMVDVSGLSNVVVTQ